PRSPPFHYTTLFRSSISGDMRAEATVKEAWARMSPSSTRRRKARFSRTTSMNCFISSSRLSFSSLWPRWAVFNRPFSRVSSIRVGLMVVEGIQIPPLILLGQILVDILGLDALELAAGQDGEQLPAQVQGLLDGPVLVGALGDVALFKLVGKLGVQQIGGAQGGLAQDGHELLVLLAGGVGGKELVHSARVVLSGLSRAGALVLQTGQGGQHVHG